MHRSSDAQSTVLAKMFDTTLMAESKEELKRLLMKVKEETEKVGLRKELLLLLLLSCFSRVRLCATP